MPRSVTVSLGDNPTNAEIEAALDAILGQQSITAEPDSDGNAWACAVVRYVNKLGPDATDKYGVMRFERVATVAKGANL